jgi:hypothetical protein
MFGNYVCVKVEKTLSGGMKIEHIFMKIYHWIKIIPGDTKHERETDRQT